MQTNHRLLNCLHLAFWLLAFPNVLLAGNLDGSAAAGAFVSCRSPVQIPDTGSVCDTLYFRDGTFRAVHVVGLRVRTYMYTPCEGGEEVWVHADKLQAIRYAGGRVQNLLAGKPGRQTLNLDAPAPAEEPDSADAPRRWESHAVGANVLVLLCGIMVLLTILTSGALAPAFLFILLSCATLALSWDSWLVFMREPGRWRGKGLMYTGLVYSAVLVLGFAFLVHFIVFLFILPWL